MSDARQEAEMREFMVVTTDGIAGFVVQQVIGEVVGLITRTLNAYSGGVVSLNGVPNPRLHEMLLQYRGEAVADMIKIANERGANAVVGMRFDHRPITPSLHELCAYGTAVIVDAVDLGELAGQPVG
jgi:uncharacterized protein YbjQ (UPF0145 family)